MLSLTTLDDFVIGEAGKVFSTSPRLATGPDGRTYYVKGCNDPIAFSEVLGCSLGAFVGLKVPAATIGKIGDKIYAAVEEVPQPERNIRPWLHQASRISNYGDLYTVVAVDAWLANDDRNMGNIVGSRLGNGRIELFMIDFEKSRALGAFPIITSGSLEPKRFWPIDELGRILKTTRPAQCPQEVIGRIKSISEEQLRGLVLNVSKDVPFVTWQDSTIDALFKRSRDIDRLVGKVWQTI